MENNKTENDISITGNPFFVWTNLLLIKVVLIKSEVLINSDFECDNISCECAFHILSGNICFL